MIEPCGREIGHDVAHRVSMEVRSCVAPTTPRGYVRFVRVRDRRHRAWICDECLLPVAPSTQVEHAARHD